MSRNLCLVIVAAIALAFLLPAVESVAATGPTIQFHSDHRGTPKLVFAPEFVARGLTEPEGIARAFVAAHHELYQLPARPDDFRLETTRQSLLGTHVTFQQYIDGIPLDGAEFIVSVANNGRILKVFNNTYPVIRRPESSIALIGSEQALDIAWAEIRVHGELINIAPFSRLVFVPQGTGFRLVHLTQIDVAAPLGSWRPSSASAPV